MCSTGPVPTSAGCLHPFAAAAHIPVVALPTGSIAKIPRSTAPVKKISENFQKVQKLAEERKGPGHSSGASGASGPVSRVLSFKTAIYLDALLPTRSSRLPGTAGPAYVSLHGVAPDRVYSDGRFHTPSGELLPRLSTIAGQRPAVYFCCTFPRVAPGGCYPLSLPCGARTFLTDGPFAPPARLSSPLAPSIIPENRTVVK